MTLANGQYQSDARNRAKKRENEQKRSKTKGTVNEGVLGLQLTSLTGLH